MPAEQTTRPYPAVASLYCLSPVCHHGMAYRANGSVATNYGRVLVTRHVAMKAGTLVGLWVALGAFISAASPTLEVAVHRLNGATNSSDQVWTSGAVPIGASPAGTWQSMGTPNVRVALGEQLDLALLLVDPAGTTQMARTSTLAAMWMWWLSTGPDGQIPQGGREVPTWFVGARMSNTAGYTSIPASLPYNSAEWFSQVPGYHPVIMGAIQ